MQEDRTMSFALTVESLGTPGLARLIVIFSQRHESTILTYVDKGNMEYQLRAEYDKLLTMKVFQRHA
jgi:hypothetical protein